MFNFSKKTEPKKKTFSDRLIQSTTKLALAQGLTGFRWTLRKVLRLVAVTVSIQCCKTTLWLVLVSANLSWKLPTKILAKANTAKRLAYLAHFDQLHAELSRGERTLVYIDEVHIHQDLDQGRGWYFKGKRWRIPSTTPGLHAKINWYGAFNLRQGQAMIWAYPKCDGSNTGSFLEHVAEWTLGQPKPTIIWDGSPVHRARVAQTKAKELGLELVPLPGYSPDLNPIEGLWKWMREEVTYAYCQPHLDALFAACKKFIAEINATPQAVIARLPPRRQLDPEEEKLRLSG
jgi:transposase